MAVTHIQDDNEKPMETFKKVLPELENKTEILKKCEERPAGDDDDIKLVIYSQRWLRTSQLTKIILARSIFWNNNNNYDNKNIFLFKNHYLIFFENEVKIFFQNALKQFFQNAKKKIT
jgi:hypothetical protein